MKLSINDLNSILYAYRLGYNDGYHRGIENNIFDGEPMEHYSYKEGYSFGITDYCDKNHPEENAEAHGE